MSIFSRLSAYVTGQSPDMLGDQPARGSVPTPIDPDDVKSETPYGTSGTGNYDGWLIPSDYNTELTRMSGLKVWERMRRSDPAVRETLMHIKAPIVNASWSIVPPTDPDDTEREITEFVRCAIFEWMSQPWTEAITHLLSFLDFGHAVVETEFQVVERELVLQTTPDPAAAPTGAPDDAAQAAADTPATKPDPKPDPPLEMPAFPTPPAPQQERLPARQFQTWRRLGPRLPNTLWKWHVNPNGELQQVDQQAPFTDPSGAQNYKIVPLPAGNLIVLTHDKWGDEYTGVSLLRAAYKPWVFKEMLEKIAGIAFERYGVGIPVAYIPREHQKDSELADSIETSLKNLRAGEQTYVIFPGPKQGSSAGAQNGYLLEIIGPAGGIPDFEAILRYFRAEIKGAMLVRFSEMGAQSGGNRATTDSLMEVYYNSLSATARYICEAMQPAIRRLVDLNYPDVQRYPKLVASGIQARNLLEFAQAIKLLADAQFIVPDTPTRAWARDEADAPEEDSREVQQHMAFNAEMQRAQAAKPGLSDGIGGAKRGPETNPSETARPRASNA